MKPSLKVFGSQAAKNESRDDFCSKGRNEVNVSKPLHEAGKLINQTKHEIFFLTLSTNRLL